MNSSEVLFQEKMLGLGREVKASNTEENMFQHIDFFVDGVSYDVKEEKKLRRSDVVTSDIIWLEMKNVRGEKGWLCSKVDKIALKQGESFYIIDREELLQ